MGTRAHVTLPNNPRSCGKSEKIKKSTFLIFFRQIFWIVFFIYTTLRAKENLHRFFGKFHTFECVKVTGKVSGKADHWGGTGPSLFTQRFIHDDDGHKRTGRRSISAIFTIRHSRRDIRGYAVYGGGGGYGGSYGGGYSSKKKSGGGFFARFKRNKGGTQSKYGGYGGDDDEDEGYGGYAGGGSAGAGSSYNSRYGSGTTGLRGASVRRRDIVIWNRDIIIWNRDIVLRSRNICVRWWRNNFLDNGRRRGRNGLDGRRIRGRRTRLSGGKGTVTLAESNPGSVVALDPTVQLDTYGGSVSFHGQIETIQTMSTDLVSQTVTTFPCFRKFQHAFRCIDDGVGADRGGHVYTTLRGTVR